MADATETFKDSIDPNTGIFAKRSHLSRVNLPRPWPSLPKTSAKGSSATPNSKISVEASESKPTVQTPFSFRSDSPLGIPLTDPIGRCRLLLEQFSLLWV